MPDAHPEITGLEKSFGALKATNDVTLDLYPGEIHALIGPNGAGKSTLIKQIAGEIRQDAGTIAFEGQPDRPPRRRRPRPHRPRPHLPGLARSPPRCRR